ncbi:MAG: hypothetical protein JNL98_38105 [Bryobacterales bacterium]|nr:hypothetical protein [Bryobacterales bacterium]
MKLDSCFRWAGPRCVIACKTDGMVVAEENGLRFWGYDEIPWTTFAPLAGRWRV